MSLALVSDGSSETKPSHERDDFAKSVSEHMSDLTEFQTLFNRCMDNLKKAQNNGDVTFSLMDDLKEVRKAFTEARSTVEKLGKAAKNRAIARMRDL